jgi:hypothetical protein
MCVPQKVTTKNLWMYCQIQAKYPWDEEILDLRKNLSVDISK